MTSARDEPEDAVPEPLKMTEEQLSRYHDPAHRTMRPGDFHYFEYVTSKGYGWCAACERHYAVVPMPGEDTP